MLAVSLLVAGWLTKKELDRQYNKGLISGIRVKDTTADKTHHGNGGEKRWISPLALVPNCIFFAAVGGIVGARLFHILENLDAFFRDPAGMIFSSGGLTLLRRNDYSGYANNLVYPKAPSVDSPLRRRRSAGTDAWIRYRTDRLLSCRRRRLGLHSAPLANENRYFLRPCLYED